MNSIIREKQRLLSNQILYLNNSLECNYLDLVETVHEKILKHVLVRA